VRWGDPLQQLVLVLVWDTPLVRGRLWYLVQQLSLVWLWYLVQQLVLVRL
jgi:hypothetical protein